MRNSGIHRFEPLERSALDHNLDTRDCSPCVGRGRTARNTVGFRTKARRRRRCRKMSGRLNSGTGQLRNLGMVEVRSQYWLYPVIGMLVFVTFCNPNLSFYCETRETIRELFRSVEWL